MSLAESLCDMSLKDLSDTQISEILGVIATDGDAGFYALLLRVKELGIDRDRVNAKSIVERCYREILKRDPDDVGCAYHQDTILSGEADAISLISTLLASQEFRQAAFKHYRITEAAVELIIPLITGKSLSEVSIRFLGGRMAEEAQISS